LLLPRFPGYPGLRQLSPRWGQSLFTHSVAWGYLLATGYSSGRDSDGGAVCGGSRPPPRVAAGSADLDPGAARRGHRALGRLGLSVRVEAERADSGWVCARSCRWFLSCRSLAQAHRAGRPNGRVAARGTPDRLVAALSVQGELVMTTDGKVEGQM